MIVTRYTVRADGYTFATTHDPESEAVELHIGGPGMADDIYAHLTRDQVDELVYALDPHA